MSDSLQPHGLQPTRVLCAWDSLGKNTAVDCHTLLQGIFPTQGSKPHLLCPLHWECGVLTTGLLGKTFIFFLTSLFFGSIVAVQHCMLPEKVMAPHSSSLAWKIPWTEEPGRLRSMGSWGVGHDWATSLSLFTLMHWRRKWQPTPVFLPGKSHAQRSLAGYSP